MSFNGTTAQDHVFGVVEDGVGTIALNRPECRNAMSTAMIEGLAELLRAVESADEFGAIVLTGADKAFCARGDVQHFDEQGGESSGADKVDATAVETQPRAQLETVGRIYRCTNPIVASLPGAAAGAGLGIALAADFRIGSSRTLMATAFAAVGLSGDFGVAWLLQQAVGPAKERELLFLNPRLDAAACLELGLLNWVAADEALTAEAAAVAQRLANGPRIALGSMKQNLIEAPLVDLEASMAAEVPRNKS